jgi:voltage-gated potassium channel
VSPQAPPQHDRRRGLRRRVYDLLDPDIQTFWDRVVHRSLIALILVNVVAVVLESVPSIDARFAGIFLVLEVASVLVFTVEYALRLWTAVEHMPVAGRSGAAARLAWARTPSAIVDLLAILPFYLALFD